ncbi:MAG: hypothetical protein JXQ29_12495 [Planctomycetes bacterium]|nr:hypothetical protein [Planctomycetota bacterium]
MDFDDFLRWLAAKNGEKYVVRLIHAALTRCRGATKPDLSLEKFLDFHGLRPTMNKAVNFRDKKILDHRRLAQVIRRLRMHGWMLNVEGESRFSPWDTWQPGARVAVVVGGKEAHITQGNHSFRRKVLGIRDAEAYAQLLTILREDAEIEFQSDLYFSDADLPPAEAQAMLDNLCRQPRIGAIVVLGSPLVNSLTDPLARLIFDDIGADELPARFRWSFDLGHPEPFLWEPESCRPGEEGIRLRGSRKTTLPRMRDEAVLERLQRARRMGTFPDCGLLAISTRHEKLLILCAGHGGCGTMAAVLALARVMVIERSLLADAGPAMPCGRIFEPLVVKRRKRSREAVDDFYIGERDWSFYWAEEDEDEGDGAAVGGARKP